MNNIKKNIKKNFRKNIKIQKNYIFIFSILVFIILILLNYLKSESYTFINKTPLVINIKKSEYPIITVICGVHGNEYAPPIGCEEFIKENNFNKGNLFFIPKVNEEGLSIKSRYMPSKSNFFNNYDINRQFGKNNNEFINTITKIVDKSNFVIDFHEGYKFHISDKNPFKSMGSTISASLTEHSIYIANYLVNDINKTIIDSNKKFVYLDDKNYDIQYTLMDYCKKKNINYNLVELTGINDAQPLDLRVAQTKRILTTLFKHLNLL